MYFLTCKVHELIHHFQHTSMITWLVADILANFAQPLSDGEFLVTANTYSHQKFARW